MRDRILRSLKFCALGAGLAVASSAIINPDNVNFLGKAFQQAEQPQSVVRVHAEHNDADFNTEHGSGVLVRSDLVLTAHHVVRDILGRDGTIIPGAKVKVEFKDGLTREAEVVKFSKEWDLALLQFDSVFYIPARPAKKPAVKDQTVTVCGFPGNKEYEERSGRVVGFRSPTRTSEPYLFIVNNRCESGMSGGPVFNENGEVVGTLFGTLRFANCTGLEAIQEFINEQVPRQRAAAPFSGNTAGDSTLDSVLRGQGSNHPTD